jgi:CBS domain-containing protein
MTPNPECVGLDTTLVDALHTMHDGKFLHLPVVDQGKILVLHFVIRS